MYIIKLSHRKVNHPTLTMFQLCIIKRNAHVDINVNVINPCFLLR